jgi:hypothetical protein
VWVLVVSVILYLRPSEAAVRTEPVPG